MSHALKFVKEWSYSGPPKPSVLAEGSWNTRLGSFRHILPSLITVLNT